jgi:hypothetical protein
MARPETRLCERCWRPIAYGTPCFVQSHVDREHPLLRPPTSYRHLPSDPRCTGSQLTDTGSVSGTAP